MNFQKYDKPNVRIARGIPSSDDEGYRDAFYLCNDRNLASHKECCDFLHRVSLVIGFGACSYCQAKTYNHSCSSSIPIANYQHHTFGIGHSSCAGRYARENLLGILLSGKPDSRLVVFDDHNLYMGSPFEYATVRNI